jgi:enamine deaminase RidA (YjgF/YER057c/UK114 family)
MELPSITPPVVAGYQPLFESAVRLDRLVLVSGRLAKRDGQVLAGRVGAGITLEQASESARGVALELLGALRDAAGGLEHVASLGRLFVMVRCADDFASPHVVANAISETLRSALGDRGGHARTAAGAAQLPFGACVEAELSAHLHPG